MTSKQNHIPPIIIPRQDHHISRKLVSPNALRALYRLRDNGYVAFLVGGCVRDLLLGREPKDFDVATSATPNEVKRIFRNCRLIGRRFRLAHLHFGDEIIEVATFRSQAAPEPEPELGQEPKAEEAVETGRHHHGRHPKHLKSDEGMILRDNVFGTPEEDARRRDFTVNALAYDSADFSIIDFTGGLADLNAGIIRTIGDPAVRFLEDPVRMLRAVRFAALLGFTMEDETRKALVAAADTIVRSSPPRLYEEMLKILLSGEGAKCCDLLRQTGLFAALFPAFSAWLNAESDGYPHTRFGEMLACVDARIQQGGKISQPLLLALLFGEYLNEKTESLRAKGMPWQQSVDAATAEFMGEVCPFVQITNRVGLALREIIALQTRLRQIPGRRPQAFVARKDFSDIIEYCRITRGDRKDVARQLEWWLAQAEQNEHEPLPALNKRSEKGEAPPSKKRRRRRRKPQGRV
jgi:poly(A) polymerase